jgi:hypothetical protein
VGCFNGCKAEIAEGPYRLSVRSVAFSRDGVRIVSGSDPTRLCGYGMHRQVQAECAGRATPGLVKSVAFSMDGMRVVSRSDDKTVRVWDVSMGVYSGHRQLPWHLTQTNWVVSSGEDHLMWVPKEAQLIVPPTILILSRHGFGSVDFRQSMLGDKWAGCYTP